jgi:hypothetical protein
MPHRLVLETLGQTRIKVASVGPDLSRHVLKGQRRLGRFLRGCRFRHPGQTREGAFCIPSILFHGSLGIAFRQKEMVGKAEARFLHRNTHFLGVV